MYLGFNDDFHADNSGSFSWSVHLATCDRGTGEWEVTGSTLASGSFNAATSSWQGTGWHAAANTVYLLTTSGTVIWCSPAGSCGGVVRTANISGPTNGTFGSPGSMSPAGGLGAYRGVFYFDSP